MDENKGWKEIKGYTGSKRLLESKGREEKEG